MRIVFDNNVLISAALLKDSAPYKALKKAAENHVILRSQSALKELRDVIYKSKFNTYFENDSAKKRFIFSYILASSDVVIKHHVSLCRDPKDNMYLEILNLPH